MRVKEQRETEAEVERERQEFSGSEGLEVATYLSFHLVNFSSKLYLDL